MVEYVPFTISLFQQQKGIMFLNPMDQGLYQAALKVRPVRSSMHKFGMIQQDAQGIGGIYYEKTC